MKSEHHRNGSRSHRLPERAAAWKSSALMVGLSCGTRAARVEGMELTCDSSEELIAFAQHERDIRVTLCREAGVDSRSSIYSRMASSPANGIRARPLDSAVRGRLVKNKTEVLNKMKSTTQSQVMAFSVEEFIRAFRPDGLGHIRMEDGEGEEVFDVTFEEIVCDICNCEMVQPEDDPLKKVVFVLDGYALCEECRERIREDESPLHIQQLKGGDLKMADENYDNTETATLVPTKAGKGYKVVHNGLWFYTSKAALWIWSRARPRRARSTP